MVAEFTEVESGRTSQRPELDKALVAARLHRVPLVVAKVDRLTRSVAFLSRLLESGVDVRFCDLPQIEGPAGRFMLNQMVAVAELEAGLISARTKAALQATKARGKVLGGNRGTKITAEAASAGRAAIEARTKARVMELAPIVEELRAGGVKTSYGLAAALNAMGIPAARGGCWRAGQVSRLIGLLDKRADVAPIAL